MSYRVKVEMYDLHHQPDRDTQEKRPLSDTFHLTQKDCQLFETVKPSLPNLGGIFLVLLRPISRIGRTSIDPRLPIG